MSSTERRVPNDFEPLSCRSLCSRSFHAVASFGKAGERVRGFETGFQLLCARRRRRRRIASVETDGDPISVSALNFASLEETREEKRHAE